MGNANIRHQSALRVRNVSSQGRLRLPSCSRKTLALILAHGNMPQWNIVYDLAWIDRGIIRGRPVLLLLRQLSVLQGCFVCSSDLINCFAE